MLINKTILRQISRYHNRSVHVSNYKRYEFLYIRVLSRAVDIYRQTKMSISYIKP
jgi:hypothetical protein